jgi:hypothetical protein
VTESSALDDEEEEFDSYNYNGYNNGYDDYRYDRGSYAADSNGRTGVTKGVGIGGRVEVPSSLTVPVHGFTYSPTKVCVVPCNHCTLVCAIFKALTHTRVSQCSVQHGVVAAAALLMLA